MAQKMEIYKCSVCGNIVEVVAGGEGTLTCCEQAMTRMEEKTADVATEKHVPFVEKQGNGIKVTVGKAALHPMAETHYIQWIEVVTNDERSCRKFLAPGQQPVASFEIRMEDVARVREYCNLHELWRSV
jgi:superoxide reductase